MSCYILTSPNSDRNTSSVNSATGSPITKMAQTKQSEPAARPLMDKQFMQSNQSRQKQQERSERINYQTSKERRMYGRTLSERIPRDQRSKKTT